MNGGGNGRLEIGFTAAECFEMIEDHWTRNENCEEKAKLLKKFTWCVLVLVHRIKKYRSGRHISIGPSILFLRDLCRKCWPPDLLS